MFLFDTFKLNCLLTFTLIGKVCSHSQLNGFLIKFVVVMIENSLF